MFIQTVMGDSLNAYGQLYYISLNKFLFVDLEF